MIAEEKFSDSYLKFTRVYNQFDDQKEMLQLIYSEKLGIRIDASLWGFLHPELE